MSFDIPIKIDPGDSLAKLKDVETELEVTERRGKAAGQAMLGASKAFQSLGEAVRKEQAALQRTNDIHRQLTAQSAPLAQGFAKVAEAIKREQDVLDKIQGPAKRYRDDLQALDSLLAKNAISTSEYADQVARLNQQIEQSPEPKAPTVGGSLMGMAGAGALPGVLLAGGRQVEELVREHEDLEDKYDSLGNKARKFADATRSTNMVIDEQTALASKLHTTADKTIELYDGVRDATDGLNISHREQIRIAQTLAEASLLGGKGVDSAAQAMQNLRVAFEVGAGQGRALSTIFKQFPDLTDHMTESLGLSKDQIIEYAETGKLGYQQVAIALTQHTEKLDVAFSQIKKLNSEQRAEIAETAVVAMGRGVPAMLAQTEAGRIWADTQTKIADGWKSDARPVFMEIAGQLEEQKIKWQRAGEAAAEAFGQKLRSLIDGVARSVGGVSGAVDKLTTSFATDGFYALVKAQDPWFVKPETPEKIKRTAKELDILADIRARLSAERAAKRNSQDFRDEQMFKDYANRGDKQQTESEKDNLKALNTKDEAEANVNQRGTDLILENGEKVKKAQEEMAAKGEEAASRMSEAWATGAGSIAGDLISAFMKGEMSVTEMVERSLQQLAILALQMAATQMGGPAGSFMAAAIGGIGGFATGGSFIVPGGPGPALPRAWSGNDWTVGGAGGTDSKMVSFMATPGERVLVQTPEQQRQSGGGSQVQRMQTIVQLQNDRRDLVAAIGSREGVREVVNIDRQMRQSRRR